MATNLSSKEKRVLSELIIPPQPDTLLKLLEEADKKEPKIDILAELIASDMAMSSVILQLVNSAEYMLYKKVTSVHKAVLMLGLARTIPLVKAIALKNAFEQSPALVNFWQQINQLGLASIRVAKQLKKPQLAETAYMLSLFHMAGIPVMIVSFDNYETDMLPRAKQDGWYHLLKPEKDYYGSCHPTIAAMLAQRWQLPKQLIEIIYHQYDLAELTRSKYVNTIGLDLISIIKIARRACLPEGEDEWQGCEQIILDQLQLDQEQLNDIFNELRPNKS
ncbi:MULTISPECIES: HDOD domain-containing protein [unclassified Motilimonas]|uniref:HDOD domain-containing protein n=1 Tax=Motilimonas TaxID=1914248 RepID=UPI001E3E8AEB|nr:MULTISPECIES: HDOD domain-containing protein [unclassified Motilimonas]MCE0555875.1 HDOD domain-containing protein [Motilimonas sp. E26]MDO6524077.1 HDOD domain-containing protein [Motilimonas sp. 1_MG-2023]